MPRQKLAEYQSKKIISKALGLPYQGWGIDGNAPLDEQVQDAVNSGGTFVVKVDEGVKGRFKKGLVALNVGSDDLPTTVAHLQAKGYSQFIIEPMVEHAASNERYISLLYDRRGLYLQYAAAGGIDIEQHAEKIQRVYLDEQTDWQRLAQETGMSQVDLRNLVASFKDNYFTFLEINPYLVQGGQLQLLDTAVEVDDAGAYFVATWNSDQFRRHSDHSVTLQERAVEELAAKSPASFKLSVLEPNGSVFLLLSGGGASIVVADEVYNQGLGKSSANYGEYSGNPNTEETYIYTKAVLELLIASAAPRKVLFVGGAVANFTDIAKTFAGVIQAIDEVADTLREQQVKIFVRRGGPNQAAGLERMQTVLTQHKLLGAVHDPSTPLTAAVKEALQEVRYE